MARADRDVGVDIVNLRGEKRKKEALIDYYVECPVL